MLALMIGKEKGTITDEKYLNIIRELHNIPNKISTILQKTTRLLSWLKHLLMLKILYILAEDIIFLLHWKVR